MPPAPKHPSARARRNKVSGARTLAAVGSVEPRPLPSLGPDYEWHELTKEWWTDVWSSAMAPEFERSDVHRLFVLARLVDAWWHEPSVSLAAEIRLQSQCFGLTPLDRRRLQWEVDRGEEAEVATQVRRNSRAPRSLPGGGAGDPRSMMG